MKVVFYFDPICPFSWITSRWLLQISPHRDVEITWRPFSLALKNDELADTASSSHYPSHRLLRVMLAAERDYSVPMIDSYTASGLLHHVMKKPYDDTGLAQILSSLDLPASLIAFADNSTLDTALQQSLDQAIAVVGDDVGVPTIVFELPDDSNQGYFGPVLNTLPELSESLDIWDGLTKLATTSSFCELKRTRPSGDPDTASTAKC